MRIIAGSLRSRPIKAPAGMDVRPTSDRLRETLFNIIAPRIEDARFLDIYAGTGAVAIEALSRGAAHATMIESNKRAARTIRDNLSALGIEQEATVVEEEAARALKRLEGNFDVIFIDPPYSMHGEYERTLSLLASSSLVSDGAVIMAEHDKRYDPGERHGALTRYRLLQQGDAALSFYRKLSAT